MNMRNYPILHRQNKIKKQGSHCCSTFQSRIFNNEQNSYSRMSVNWPLALKDLVIKRSSFIDLKGKTFDHVLRRHQDVHRHLLLLFSRGVLL